MRMSDYFWYKLKVALVCKRIGVAVELNQSSISGKCDKKEFALWFEMKDGFSWLGKKGMDILDLDYML